LNLKKGLSKLLWRMDKQIEETPWTMGLANVEGHRTSEEAII